MVNGKFGVLDLALQPRPAEDSNDDFNLLKRFVFQETVWTSSKCHVLPINVYHTSHPEKETVIKEKI